MPICCFDIISLVLIILQQLLYKLLPFLSNHRTAWELHLPRVQHHLILKNPLLTHIMPEGFNPKQQLVENNPNRKNINLRGDFRGFINTHDEALRREVPIGPNALGGELYFGYV